MSTPREEEQVASRRLRQAQKMQKAAERRRARERRERLAAIIREELARARSGGRKCSCGLRAGMSEQELGDLGSGCTAGRWVCPTLDSVRRRLTKKTA